MQKLLEQLIICVNYAEMLESDIEEIVRETRTFFVEKGFSISTGIHKNINVQLNDPQAYEEVVNSNIDTLKKYVFSKKNVTINVTKVSLDICVIASVEYQGAKIYQEYISYIYNEFTKRFSGIIDISRIGIRKINSLFIRNIDSIEEYFNKNIFNCFSAKMSLPGSSGTINVAGGNLNIRYDDHKVNLNTEIQVGEAREIVDGIVNNFNVYRIILDIDAYWDKEVGELVEKIEDKLNSLSELTTNIYNVCLNENFKQNLEKDIAAKDKNIFGGIK